MEKLTPQNAEQEHMIQILLAKMQGVPVEYKRGTDWCPAVPDSVSLNTEYRIVPQPTPLPITRNMWRKISKKWKYAAMDKDGEVYFYINEPYTDKDDDCWNNCSSSEYCRSVLFFNIDGINWSLSLTKRPEDV
ncbi:hypothetical protein GQ597_11350 [Gilliamella sp. Pra-s65]|uniref:hypothetical protein n=1 Tax=unclassified Gilliamella TaxID=2685620 RepID=UPI00136527DB|nr:MULTISPECIES: hypothetical protein [unclassified Gilliamella]MWN91294.1 hypothetical protein [Gilliamella sp. Pra-s65]MWP74270.1 hypothetical protein [Gilliamella sp. Pra-s52]